MPESSGHSTRDSTNDHAVMHGDPLFSELKESVNGTDGDKAVSLATKLKHRYPNNLFARILLAKAYTCRGDMWRDCRALREAAGADRGRDRPAPAAPSRALQWGKVAAPQQSKCQYACNWRV